MRRFSPLTAPFYAFFSRELYVDAARNWRVAAFVYLLVLVIVSVMPFMYDAQTGLSTFVREEVPMLAAQIPPTTIENGVVHADVEQPYFIRDAQTGEVVAIIDTTGEYTSLDGAPARILVTRTQLFFEKNDAETRVYDLGAIQHFQVDGPLIEKWAAILGSWGIVLLFPFVLVGVYAYRAVQGLFYSLFALLMARVFGCRLPYPGLLNVALVALGPVIVIKLVVDLAGVKIPLSWLVYFLVAMGFIAFGVSANKDAATPPEETA